MQARLRSDRIHAAAVASLPYWQKLLDEAMSEYYERVEKEVEELLTRKTWCGGFKFNDETARKHLNYPHYIWGRSDEPYYGEKVEVAQKIIARVERLVRLTADIAKPFPMLLDEADYNKIWKEL